MYRKHFIPLESNPDVFNELAALLGVSPHLQFEDIFTLDDATILPHPTHALILVFPTTDKYGMSKKQDEHAREEYAGFGDGEEVIWFRQTINNACGLYALLHAVANCTDAVAAQAEPGSLIKRLIEASLPLPPAERAAVLEESVELEAAYAEVALKGNTIAPEHPEDEVDFHYICFVRSPKTNEIYELDGDSKGPKSTGVRLVGDQDMLSQETLRLVRRYIDRGDGDVQFNMMALVERDGTLC